MASDNVLHEKVKQHFGLGFFQTLDFGDEFPIDEEAFLPSDRVHPDKGMHGSDRILSHKASHHTRVGDHL